MSVFERCAHRAFSVLMLTLTAGILIPAVNASAHPSKGTPTGPEAALRQLHFGVQLVDIPVSEKQDPRAWQYIIDNLPTGAVIHRRIMIVNREPKAADFAVFPGAAQITGGKFVGAPDGVGNELTGWIKVQHATVRIGPGQSVMDQVTIRVPQGATKGEHYGVIWTEQAAPAKGNHRIALRVTARVGVRIYLAVGRGGLPATKFEIMSITAQRPTPDRPLLIVHVDNVGGRAVDLSGRVQLTNGPGRSSSGPFGPERVPTLAPGQSGNVLFALPPTLPAGPWLATVTLQSGLDVATAQATVLFAAPVGRSWFNAATLAGGAALVLLIALATTIGVRMRRARRALA